jgi:Permeases of the drug/metabolite transporter (DMT) superfamily
MRISSRVSLPRPTRHELALLGITMIWGATFLVVHLAVQTTGPWFFVGVRFAIAGLAMLLISWRVLRGITRTDLLAGGAIGLTIMLGYGLQTDGLQTIESSTSAFITAFYVPLVPLLQWAVFRKPPRLTAWLGIAAAFVGLLLLAGPDANGFSFGYGETITLVSTLAIAAEVVLISAFAPRVDARRVTVVQLLAASLFAFVAMPIVGEGIPEFSWVWLVAAAAMGLASALIQLTMNWAQRRVSPTRATVIYAGEPVWAGVVGRIAGERLPALAFVGAALIVAGILLSELKFTRRREPESEPAS